MCRYRRRIPGRRTLALRQTDDEKRWKDLPMWVQALLLVAVALFFVVRLARSLAKRAR